VRDSQRIQQDVVLGYWDELLRFEPDALQARVDAGLERLAAPAPALFGRPIT
jgi:hypothetical protein